MKYLKNLLSNWIHWGNCMHSRTSKDLYELDKFGKNWPDVTRRLLKTFRTLSGNVANYWSKRSIYQDILSFDAVNISFSGYFYCQKRWVLQIWNRKNSSECAEANYAVKFIELVIHTDTFKDILKSDNFPWDDKSYSSCRNIRKYTLYLNAIRISLPKYINNRLSSFCVSIGFSETIENCKKKCPADGHCKIESVLSIKKSWIFLCSAAACTGHLV